MWNKSNSQSNAKNASKNNDEKIYFYISNMHRRRISFEIISWNKNDSVQKVEKSDYIFFKVFRFIALLNTMDKMLKSVMTNKITKLTKKIYITIKVINERKTNKTNRNDAKNANEKNTCNMKTRQRQSDHDHERECNKNIRSSIACQIITQF